LLRRRETLPAWVSQIAPPIVTMFISGLWHGVGATFLFWGSAYGILIAVYQLLGLGGDWKPSNPAVRLLAWLIMFSLISFLFLIFGAPSLTWVWNALSSPFFGTRDQQAVSLFMLSLTTIYSIPLIIKLLLDHYVKSASILYAFYFSAATLVTIIFTNSATPDFIYFKF